jgi:hypothetical protein
MDNEVPSERGIYAAAHHSLPIPKRMQQPTRMLAGIDRTSQAMRMVEIMRRPQK